nr:hypothetical protein [Sphingomonas daechungensis]
MIVQRRTGPRGTHHLGRRLTLHSKGNEHPGDFGRLELSQHEAFEQVLAILERKVLAVEQSRQRIGHGAGVDDGVSSWRDVGGLKHSDPRKWQ